MKTSLQRGQFLRVVDGAGSTLRRLLVAFSLAATTLAGCANFAVEEQSPYPTRFRNDNRHPA